MSLEQDIMGFLSMKPLSRFRSAMWAYDLELIKCKDYAKLLKTIKKDL